jgi:Meckelin (Transmembrane protein 67)
MLALWPHMCLIGDSCGHASSVYALQVPSESSSACQCAAGFRRTFPANRYDPRNLGQCVACPQAVSLDGLRCVSCDGSTSGSQRAATLHGSQCVCSDNSDQQGVISDTSPDGELLRADDGTYLQQCHICPSTSRPDAAAGACAPCEYPRVSSLGRCVCPGVVPAGARCSDVADSTRVATVLSVTIGQSPYAASAQQITNDGVSTFQIGASAALLRHQASSAADCLDTGDRQACNTLANLCVLQRYSRRASCPCWHTLC